MTSPTVFELREARVYELQHPIPDACPCCNRVAWRIREADGGRICGVCYPPIEKYDEWLALQRGDETVTTDETPAPTEPAPPPTVERPVFTRLSKRDSKRLTQQAGQGELW